MENVTVRHLNELKDLIQLAENSSDLISDLKAKNRNILYLFFLIGFIVILIFIFIISQTINPTIIIHDSKNSDDALTGMLLAFVILTFTISMKYLQQFFKNQHKLNREEKVIAKLLSMISEYKEFVFANSQVSAVEKATIEIRLERISYSS